MFKKLCKFPPPLAYFHLSESKCNQFLFERVFRIGGIKIHALTTEDALKIVLFWLNQKRHFHYICSTNFNNLATAFKSKDYFEVMENADLSLPDGMPLIWYARLLGFNIRGRSGIEELMLRVFELSKAGYNFSHFFYGNTNQVLKALKDRLLTRYPQLRIAGMHAPSFKQPPPSELKQDLELINDSQPDFLWVSLGCPKQETWLYQQRHRLKVVVAGGAGAVFNLLAGFLPQPPSFIRQLGLEWCWRLGHEPKRLAKRYLIKYPHFLVKLLRYHFKNHLFRNQNCK